MPTGMTPPPTLSPGVTAVAWAPADQPPTPMSPSRKGCQSVRAFTTTPKAPLGMLEAPTTSPSASPSSSTYWAATSSASLAASTERMAFSTL
jgi:hypothetical protein